MAILHNETMIDAPLGKIWEALANIENLAKYDPTVKKSTAISTAKSGLGAKRKVEMQDGKNWFDEQITAFKPEEALTYELTACSFPIHKLKHSYSFAQIGSQIKIEQQMEYEVKFGFFGKIMDALMIRKQFDRGIKLFLEGLKTKLEYQQHG